MYTRELYLIKWKGLISLMVSAKPLLTTPPIGNSGEAVSQPNTGAFGFSDNNGMQGFQPAGWGSGSPAFTAQGEGEEYLDEEERERVERVIAQNEERK